MGDLQVLGTTMNPEDGLITLAQIAITLAGFAGLIASFRNGACLSLSERFRVLIILRICFLVVLCSMLPFFTASYFSESSPPWRVSCLIFGVCYGIIIGRAVWLVARGNYRPAVPHLSYPMIAVAAAVALVALLAALDFGLKASPELLGLFLTWALFAAAMFFIMTLQAIWKSGDKD